MQRMRRWLLLAIAVAAGGACASGSSWDRYLRDGQHLELLRTYEADPAAHDSEDALYVAGLSYASPDSPTHDPAIARRLFQRLIDLHPQSELRVVVDPILGLYDDLEVAEEGAAALRAERDSARAEVERLRMEVARMRLSSQLYSDLSRHFRQAMGVHDARARSLQRQLEELKRIDLGQ